MSKRFRRRSAVFQSDKPRFAAKKYRPMNTSGGGENGEFRFLPELPVKFCSAEYSDSGRNGFRYVVIGS